MTNTNEATVEKMYKTRMSSNSQASSEDNKIIEQQHTRSEIISHAVSLISKEIGPDLATYVQLEEVGTRGKVGEDTVYGYVNTAGEKVEFTDELKLKAAITVLNLNGHFFEATAIN